MSQIEKAAAGYIEELTNYISNRSLMTTQVQDITKCVVDILNSIPITKQFKINVGDKFTMLVDGLVTDGEVIACNDKFFTVLLSHVYKFYLPYDKNFLDNFDFKIIKKE